MDACRKRVHLGSTDLDTIPLSTLPPPPSAAPGISSLEAFDELIAAVADLQEATERELRERREYLRWELASVEAELADLAQRASASKAAKAEQRGQAQAPVESTREITLPELLAELEAAPDHTLNIRKANLDVKRTKALIKANPELLRLGGKGAWPTVTLAKSSAEATTPAKGAKSPQGVFSFGETASAPREQKKKRR